ncbi:MAG: hypothetical protein APF80_03125 [Alphaproteobacteria bacterium BRH_c36]|nr:MAG: hypothetical protein APF80_03125 [Alphaproteobacteria bacterium BRH_c36]
MPHGWTGETPAEASILVHETVHHLQHGGNLHYDCPQARERLAYAAQQRWLADHGLTLAETFGVDDLTISVRSMCDHP